MNETDDSLKLGDAFESADAKRRYNEWVFSLIAPEYDAITRILSLGRDASWKRRMVAQLPDCAAPCCLDLACGTGDLCGLLRRRYPQGNITGVDLSDNMLAIARHRHATAAIHFLRQDLGKLEFPDASFDIVTGGYALRNAPDLQAALLEIRRVLKPGGMAAFLDFSKAPRGFSQRLGHAVLKSWGGFWGLVMHGNPEVYGYIAESLRRFPDRGELHVTMNRICLQPVATRLFFLGLIELTLARAAGENTKPAPPGVK